MDGGQSARHSPEGRARAIIKGKKCSPRTTGSGKKWWLRALEGAVVLPEYACDWDPGGTNEHKVRITIRRHMGKRPIGQDSPRFSSTGPYLSLIGV